MANEVRIDITARNMAGGEFNATNRSVNQTTRAVGQMSDKFARAGLAARTAGSAASKAGRDAAVASELAAKAADNLAVKTTEAAEAARLAAQEEQKWLRGEVELAAAEEAREHATKKAAEEALAAAAAARAEADALDKTERASLKATAAQLAFAKAAQVAGKESGEQGGEGFLAGLKDALGGESAMTYVAPVLVGAAVAAVPLVAAALGGAVIEGIAGAGIAAAIVGQLHDPQVRSAWHDFAADGKAELKDVTSGLAPELAAAAGYFSNTLKAAKPDLTQFFNDLQPVIANLTEGIGGFVTGSIQGLDSLGKAAGPVSVELSNALSQAGVEFGDFLKDISSDTQGAGDALLIMVAVFSGALRTLGGLIKVSEAVIDTAMNNLETNLGAAGKALQALGVAGSPAEALGRKLTGVSNNIGRMRDQSAGAATATESFTKVTYESSRSLDAQAKSADKSVDSFDQLLNVMSGVADTELDVKDAIHDFTKSLKDNGDSIDINTQKGRDNRRAFNQAAEAAERHRQAMLDAGQSAKKADAAFDREIGSLVAAARAAGLNTRQINAMLHAMGLIRNKNGKITIIGARKAKSDADGVTSSMNRIPSHKTSIIDTIFRSFHKSYHESFTSAHAAGGVVGAFTAAATGGNRSGGVLVGEQGPEIVDLPAGSRVTSNPDTQRRLAQGDGGPTKVELILTGGDPLARALLNVMRAQVRTVGGGSVSKTFQGTP